MTPRTVLRPRSSGLLPLLAALVMTGWCALPGDAQVVKVATLVPDGSVWDLILEEQAEAWEQGTDGRLDVRLYPGGVAGDDPAIVRKLRIGQFQAAALTFQGLMEIDEGFRVFALPVFYRSQDEFLQVVEALEPVMRNRLADKGFVLLNWGYAGWARFYSKRPIRAPDDLRSQKLFLWGGDEQSMRIYRSHGLQPVGVAGTDVTLALQTGMIECIGTPPLVALTLQYFRQAPYQLDQPIAPLLGATIMAKRLWDSLSPGDQRTILEASAVAERRYLEEVPGQETRAITEMEDRGLIRTTIAPGTSEEWDALASALAADFRGGLVPADVFDLAVRARDEIRSREPDG